MVETIIPSMRPALFLDRDGVIIQNRKNYVRSWEDVEIFPQALRALKNAASTVPQIVVVTNQSAVGRGMLTHAEALAINDRLVDVITRAGGRIDGVYMCPHTPEIQCDCRKPEPGLIFRARDELAINLGESAMIGDAVTDLQAGYAAGIGTLALVQTGRGVNQQILAKDISAFPITIHETLERAIEALFFAL